MQDKVKRDMGDLSNGLDFSNLPDSLFGRGETTKWTLEAPDAEEEEKWTFKIMTEEDFRGLLSSHYHCRVNPMGTEFGQNLGQANDS